MFRVANEQVGYLTRRALEVFVLTSAARLVLACSPRGFSIPALAA